MKGKLVFGALVMSVALCSQVFGLDLLNNLTGLNSSGCQPCAAPGAGPAAKACCPEPACAPACAPRRGCDLFAGIHNLLCCHRCGKQDCCGKCDPGCPKPCDPACPKPCDPACGQPCGQACGPICRVRQHVRCCDPVCACDPPACAPACGKPDCPPCCGRCRRLGNGLILCILDELFCGHRRCCCGPNCPGCVAACGPAGAAPAAPAGAPAAAPAPKAVEPAPLPAAPKTDPSAYRMPGRTIFQASRSIVRN